MVNKYYYLISSLGQLQLDDYKEPYRVDEFVEELHENLTPVHFGYIKDILRVYDNAHLVDCVLENQNPWVLNKGNWTFDEIKKRMPLSVYDEDEYIAGFIKKLNSHKQSKQKFLRSEIEKIIWQMFYSKMVNHKNTFISQYFSFDLELKNIIAALNKREFKIKEDVLMHIGDNYVTDKLRTSTANDFGLAKDLDYIQGLLDVYLKKDSLSVEKFADNLRWEKIDNINALVYFNIDILLGYLVKLMLVERWIFLDEVKGEESFQRSTEIKPEVIFQ